MKVATARIDVRATRPHSASRARSVVYSDDVFKLPSAALTAALSRLYDLCRLGGFRVHRPHRTEATIRAYVGKRSRPLANPRLCKSVRAGRRSWPGTCLVLFVWPGEHFGTANLGRFDSDAACTLHSYRSDCAESSTELAFIMPIRITRAGTFPPECESAIVAGLRRVSAHLAPLAAL